MGICFSDSKSIRAGLSVLKIFLFGVLIGAIFIYNYVLKDIKYRISFYGYTVKDGKPWPLIKLRKLEKSSVRMFNSSDEGIEVSGIFFNVPGQSVEFTDEQVKAMIKDRYCK